MTSSIRRAAAHVGLFFALLFLLWLGLLLSALIPNDALYGNFESSALSYAQQDAYQFHGGERWNTIADNYADAILLNIAWHMGRGDPLVAVFDTDYFDGGSLGENTGLYYSVTDGAPPNTDYTRYWHGGALPLRLLHLVTDVEGCKVIGFAAALALLGLTAALLIRRGHGDIAALLVISLAAVQIWNISLSLEYQSAFLVAFTLCPLYLLLERRGDLWLTLLSVAGGTAIAFFDFLTTETLTLLLPLILVVAVRGKERRLSSLRETFFLLFCCGMCWLLAYAGCFLVKWAAAGLVTGESVFSLALSFAARRVGGQVQSSVAPPDNVFSAIGANLTALFGGTARIEPVRAILGLAICCGMIGSLWYLFRRKTGQRDAALVLLLLGSVVFLRLLALNNHSYLHNFFTYRALSAPILAVLLALRLNIGPPERGNRR